MRRAVTVIALVLAPWLSACSGDSVDNTDVDPPCSGEMYQLCATEHGCADMNCRTVGTDMICTQACSADIACPATEDGQAVPCNAMNLCEPPEPTSCRFPQ